MAELQLDGTQGQSTNPLFVTNITAPTSIQGSGIAGVRFTSADASAADVPVTSAPVLATQKLVITNIIVSTDTAMRVDFKEETTGTVLISVYLPANGSLHLTPMIKLATANKRLTVRTSVAGNIAVTAKYYSEL